MTSTTGPVAWTEKPGAELPDTDAMTPVHSPNGVQREPGDSQNAQAAMLQVVLEEIGSGSGRRVWLRRDQRLSVGRTEEADLSFPRDSGMSHVHFVIDCCNGVCRVRDRSTTNGTHVNDSPVRSAILSDGDVIRAGNTLFRANIQGGRKATASDVKTASSVEYSYPVTPITPVSYHREVLRDDLLRLRGGSSDTEPATVAQHLASMQPLYVLVDFSRLDRELPDEVTEPAFLLDWLPESVAAARSPVLLSAAEYPDIRSLIGEGWGRDALICFFTRLEKADLLHLLRADVRGQPVQAELSERPERIVGFYMPSILGALIRNGPPGKWSELFPGIDAVLIENEENWELLMPQCHEQRLREVDFVAENDTQDQTES